MFAATNGATPHVKNYSCAILEPCHERIGPGEVSMRLAGPFIEDVYSEVYCHENRREKAVPKTPKVFWFLLFAAD